MQIRTLHLSEDGVSRTDDAITLIRHAPGQITLNNREVLAIRPLDRCTLALELLGETRYLASADYWHAPFGPRNAEAREAGCLLGHLDSLAIAAHRVLDTVTGLDQLPPEARVALDDLRTALNDLKVTIPR
ncbi:hypothetical protein [uncultured Chloroflexus sp.]|uniref:hypothetical protein n=1 Tax=uncultured Chloroflexus sp. TaxID=214040 RepID=UPI00261B145D|nr:hypothetical protein [uncultured Chloroflexus sp.]